VGGFDSPCVPQPGYRPNSIQTLDPSLQHCTHSAKRALIKAIASLQQSTHKAKCTLYGRFCSLRFIYMCIHCKIIFLYHNCSITIFFRSRFSLSIFYKKIISGLGFSKQILRLHNKTKQFFKCSKRSGSE